MIVVRADHHDLVREIAAGQAREHVRDLHVHRLERDRQRQFAPERPGARRPFAVDLRLQLRQLAPAEQPVDALPLHLHDRHRQRLADQSLAALEPGQLVRVALHRRKKAPWPAHRDHRHRPGLDQPLDLSLEPALTDREARAGHLRRLAHQPAGHLLQVELDAGDILRQRPQLLRLELRHERPQQRVQPLLRARVELRQPPQIARGLEGRRGVREALRLLLQAREQHHRVRPARRLEQHQRHLALEIDAREVIVRRRHQLAPATRAGVRARLRRPVRRLRRLRLRRIAGEHQLASHRTRAALRQDHEILPRERGRRARAPGLRRLERLQARRLAQPRAGAQREVDHEVRADRREAELAVTPGQQFGSAAQVRAQRVTPIEVVRRERRDVDGHARRIELEPPRGHRGRLDHRRARGRRVHDLAMARDRQQSRRSHGQDTHRAHRRRGDVVPRARRVHEAAEHAHAL